MFNIFARTRMIEYCFPESILVYKFIKNIASCEKMYIEINSTRLLSSHLFPLLKCYLSRARFRYLRITNLHPISLPPSLPFPPPFVITRSLRKSSIFNVINISIDIFYDYANRQINFNIRFNARFITVLMRQSYEHPRKRSPPLLWNCGGTATRIFRSTFIFE